MIYEPRNGTIEGTEYLLCGAPMVTVSIDGRAHALDVEVFRLFYRPVEVEGARFTASATATMPPPAECEAATVTRANMRAVREQLPANLATATRKSPARSRLAAEIAQRGYPEALRDPRATGQRAVWVALGIEPSGVDGLERTTGLDNKQVSMALMALRGKYLVHKRDSDGAWERTREE